jgi:hypothetical protein
MASPLLTFLALATSQRPRSRDPSTQSRVMPRVRAPKICHGSRHKGAALPLGIPLQALSPLAMAKELVSTKLVYPQSFRKFCMSYATSPVTSAHDIPPDLLYSLHAFISHRHQLAFQVDTKFLLASLSAPSPGVERAHPSLRNIIFALGCYFSRLSWLGTQEAHFVDQALQTLQSGLSKGEKLLDIVQACCLLASYSFLKGNVLEINYHVACATRLATGLGLHQILTSPYGSPWALNNTIAIPSRDGAEVIDAATAFWVCIFHAFSLRT